MRALPVRYQYRKCKILIMGGGIGASSTAHHLVMSQFPGQDIIMVERNSSLGGIARSGEVSNTGTNGRRNLPTEVSWRVFGDDYHCCHSIFKDIPIGITDANGKPLTVENNMQPIRDPFLIISEAGEDVYRDKPQKEQQQHRRSLADPREIRATGKISSLFDFTRGFWPKLKFTEKLHIVNRLAYAMSCCRSRLENEMCNITWNNFMSPLPDVAEPFIVRPIAPIFGIDMMRASAASVNEYLEHWNTKQTGDAPYTYVTAKPINEAWFDPWKIFLEKKGVRIYLNSTVERIVEAPKREVTDAPRIEYVECILADSPPNTITRIQAEWYCCGLPIERAVQALPTTYPMYRSLTRLQTLGFQEMACVQVFLPKRVCFPHDQTGIIIIDSPWQLIIEPQAAFWRQSTAINTTSCFEEKNRPDKSFIASHYGDSSVKDIWSIGLCDSKRVGRLYGKSWLYCSREEIYDEVWEQLTQSSVLRKRCFGIDGTPLAAIRPVRWELWPSWKQNPQHDNKMETFEPKTSPNAGTRAVSPSTQSEYVNMVFAAVYVKAGTFTYRMELAASNGFQAAKRIMQLAKQRSAIYRNTLRLTGHATEIVYDNSYGDTDHIEDDSTQYVPPRAYPLLFGPTRLIDAVFSAINLPHPSWFIAGQSLIMVVIVWIAFAYFAWRGFIHFLD